MQALGYALACFGVGAFGYILGREVERQDRTAELLKPANRILRAYCKGARDGRGALLGAMRKAGEN